VKFDDSHSHKYLQQVMNYSNKIVQNKQNTS